MVRETDFFLAATWKQKGGKETRWWPGSRWEERGIGSSRRRLQKDSRERGSGIFIIGIPVTVSKPFTALISVAEPRWKRTLDVKREEGKERMEKRKRKRNDPMEIELVLLFVLTNFEENSYSWFDGNCVRLSSKDDRKGWSRESNEDRMRGTRWRMCWKEEFDDGDISKRFFLKIYLSMLLPSSEIILILFSRLQVILCLYYNYTDFKIIILIKNDETVVLVYSF